MQIPSWLFCFHLNVSTTAMESPNSAKINQVGIMPEYALASLVIKSQDKIKAKPHGCCIFSMILHEAPGMETTTPKGEWFPFWVAEWSIMENMQQQMWFCFYPSPISINISIYVYNALRLNPEIWFWAMPFASFQIDINNYFAIVSPRCQVVSHCDVMSPWITWQNNRLMISRFTFFSENTCYKQRYAISKVTGY